MKATISIIVLVLLVLLIVLGIRIYNQNKKIDSIDRAEVTETTTEENTEVETEGNEVIITKTPSGISSEGEFEIDEENTYLRFTGFGPGKEHPGSFNTMTANIVFDEGSVTGGKLVIEASSIDTGIGGLDSHLKTEDFLNVEVNPQIEFVLNEVVINDADQTATANGDLTMNGITKNISAPLTILANGFSTDFILDSSLFGISYVGANKDVQIEAQVIWK